VHKELRRPHLILPDLGGDDGIRRNLAKLLDHILGLDDIHIRNIAQRIVLLPALHLLIPLPSGFGPHLLGQSRQCIFGVSHYRDIHPHILAHLSRVHIDVNYPGMGSKAGYLARDPVVEARTHG